MSKFKYSVLIVDDEDHAINRLKRLLSGFDTFNVVGDSNDLSGAVKLIVEKNPDILFLDIEMQSESGFEVVDAIKGLSTRTSIVFVTAHKQYAIDAIKAEAFDYLLKPIHLPTLKATLERFIKKRKGLDSTLFPSCLSTREKEILSLILSGNSSKDIAKELYISKHTVDTHRRNVLKKLNLHSTAELFSLFQ